MEKLVCLDDFEKAASNILDKNALDFYKDGADDQITLRENKRAFNRIIIRPRMLVDISSLDLSTTVLGGKIGFPLGVAPVAMQRMAHEDGEIASARAASAMGTIFVLSSAATSTIEEIAQANPKGRKWFQLYVHKNREQNVELIRRAESAGFEALVITVDAPLLGNRLSSIRNEFRLPKHLRLGSYKKGKGESEETKTLTTTRVGGSALTALDEFMDTSLTWSDISQLKKITKLAIIVKGIMTAEDARLAILHGVDGIYVSNHGGRQLDTVHATIDVLPEIVKAVNGKCDVFLDSGISKGTDIFKALAMGATMVFSGRPILWGLAVGGEQGAKRILEVLKEELYLTMALAGVTDIAAIKSSSVQRVANL